MAKPCDAGSHITVDAADDPLVHRVRSVTGAMNGRFHVSVFCLSVWLEGIWVYVTELPVNCLGCIAEGGEL